MLSFYSQNYRKAKTSLFYKTMAHGTFEYTSIHYHISWERWEKNHYLLQTVLDTTFQQCRKMSLPHENCEDKNIWYMHGDTGSRETRCIPNPNSCSSRIPMKTRLNILASIWKTPACNHMQEIRRHAWCLWTTFSTSRAPIFSNLNRKK